MSFQAYLDTIETTTGMIPRQLLALAKAKGFEGKNVKAAEVLAWLKADFDLGRGHGMAIAHVIKLGPRIDPKHVGTTGQHRPHFSHSLLERGLLKADIQHDVPARRPNLRAS